MAEPVERATYHIVTSTLPGEPPVVSVIRDAVEPPDMPSLHDPSMRTTLHVEGADPSCAVCMAILAEQRRSHPIAEGQVAAPLEPTTMPAPVEPAPQLAVETQTNP